MSDELNKENKKIIGNFISSILNEKKEIEANLFHRNEI